MMSRYLALAAAAIILSAGCAARPSTVDGAYTEGGYGSPFYAEVSHASKDGDKPRLYLFGKIADYDAFLATKSVPENAHRKFIGKGVNRETIVVQDLVGSELKDNPGYTSKLVEKYGQRHAVELAAKAK